MNYNGLEISPGDLMVWVCGPEGYFDCEIVRASGVSDSEIVIWDSEFSEYVKFDKSLHENAPSGAIKSFLVPFREGHAPYFGPQI